ncbi:MAG TPA: YraN family protein [Rhodanobacteraceae bacterium]|nr:YraN family protein [Rhodanobacteraceae bacterium]
MRSTGAAFETLACRHLEAAGLRLLERNFTTRYGELDLVMMDGATLVFVEVRYRAGQDFGGALASITATKRARLVRAASLYLAAHPRLAQSPSRFDVVAFDGTVTPPACRWLRAAFDAI